MLERETVVVTAAQSQMSTLEVAQESHFLIKQVVEALRICQSGMLERIQLQYHA